MYKCKINNANVVEAGPVSAPANINNKPNANDVGVACHATQRGITLIALIITIIILLILAGVTISLTLGDNGLFKTAKEAVKNYTNEADRELALIGSLGNTIEEVTVEETDYNALKKVNKPKTDGTGLIPVTINADGTLKPISDKDGSWYNYDTNKWANAKTKDDSLWVWIPRYAYKITYTNPSDKSAGGTIDVVFLKDTSNKDFNGKDVTDANYVDEKGNKGAYIVHPAFKDGTSNWYANGEWNKEITGIWMAKFEAGYAGYVGEAGTPNFATDSKVKVTVNNQTTNYYGTRSDNSFIKYPEFKANRPSMNYLGISDSFDLCRSLTALNNPYGFTNKVNSHLTKNSEWGAVAYLTHSKYGRNGQEVRINNVNANNSTATNGENTIYAVTGYGASAHNAAEDKSRNLATLTVNGQTGSWTTGQGQTASSTGNITGIYDLSGGLYEWTAGYVAPTDTTGAYETYGGSLKGDSNEYKSKYAGTSSDGGANYNETANVSRLGEAIWETSKSGSNLTSWNSDYSDLWNSIGSFSLRGGYWRSTSGAGVFSFSTAYGSCVSFAGFRPVLVAE